MKNYLNVLFIYILCGQTIYMIERCEENKFKCGGPRWRCIAQEHVCDGHRECEDGSDETSNLCQFRSCSRFLDFAGKDQDAFSVSNAHHFRCSYGACIPILYVCNGRKNCFDGSDEAYEVCSQNRCRENEFQCNYGGCVLSRYRCDGRADCSDGSDETSGLCAKFHRRCRRSYFRCDYGACIHRRKKCNGKADCVDGSDESKKLCGPNHHFKLSTTTSPQTTQYSSAMLTTTFAPNPIAAILTSTFFSTSAVGYNSSREIFSTTLDPPTPTLNLNQSNIPNNQNKTSDHVASSPAPYLPTPTRGPSEIATEKTINSTTEKPINSSGSSRITNQLITISCPENQCRCPSPLHICVPCLPNHQDVVQSCQNIVKEERFCTMRPIKGVKVDIISCGSPYQFTNIANEFHRSSSQSCVTIFGAPPGTLAFVDCWDRSSYLKICQPDGMWYHSTTLMDGRDSTPQLCQDNKLNPKVCGKLPLVRKTRNGGLKWPFLVSLIESEEFSCSGTLISSRFVLTAAHCVLVEAERRQNQPGYDNLRIEHALSDNINESAKVSSIFIHPNFTYLIELHNDIALIQLEFPLTLTEELVPACIDGNEYIYAPIAISFQRNENPSKMRWTLFTETFFDLSWLDKESFCFRHLEVQQGEFCAKSLDSKEILQPGTSGGPYLVNTESEHNEKWTVAGVLSYVIHTSGCPRRTVFTSVQDHWQWIYDCIDSHNCPAFL